MKQETIKVRIIDEETRSWYRGRIGDILTVFKEPSTEYNFNNILAYKLHPSGGRLILAKNCKVIDEYPTLVSNYGTSTTI